MNKQYEKPLTEAIQLMTEGVIAASEVFVVGSTLFGPEKIDDANIIGDSTGEAW